MRYSFVILAFIILCLLPQILLAENKGNLNLPPLEIKGAKVSTESQARTLARDAYFKRTFRDYGISTTEDIADVSIIKIGFNIPCFANKGYTLWEARAIDLAQWLFAILWINSQTGQIKFIVERITNSSSE